MQVCIHPGVIDEREPTMLKRKTFFLSVVFTVAVLLLLFLGGRAILSSSPPPIMFLGHDLSGFTARELPALLSFTERNWLNEPIEVVIDNQHFLLDKQELGISWDDRAVRRAIMQADENDDAVPLTILYNEEKMYTALQKIAKDVYIPPLDAKSEPGMISPSLPGRELDIDKANEVMRRRLITGQSHVALDCFHTLLPRIQTVDLMTELGFPHLLGTYTTCLAPRDEETLFNITKACSSIHGVRLETGSVFSFNREVGPAEKEDGYLETRIVVNGRVVPGYGGGICQVSSTLYNTLLASGGEIVERHPHSGYSETTSYVPPGLDAAVSYGHLDLRFRFPQQQVKILAYILRDSLVTEIWGEREEPLQRNLSTQLVDFRDDGNGEGILEVRTISHIAGETEFEHRDMYRIPADYALTLMGAKDVDTP